MHFSTILASAAALAMGVSGASLPRQDKHVADFRIFGEDGCFKKNNGVWTVLESDTNKCTSFSKNSENFVKSVSLGDINQGCKLWIYTDLKCNLDKREIPVGECRGGEKEFRSWEIKC